MNSTAKYENSVVIYCESGWMCAMENVQFTWPSLIKKKRGTISFVYNRHKLVWPIYFTISDDMVDLFYRKWTQTFFMGYCQQDRGQYRNITNFSFKIISCNIFRAWHTNSILAVSTALFIYCCHFHRSLYILNTHGFRTQPYSHWC